MSFHLKNFVTLILVVKSQPNRIESLTVDVFSLWDERDKPLVGPERSGDTKSK